MLSDVSEVDIASTIRAFIALVMEAVRISEMSVCFYQTTRCNIPETVIFK
jgi:hypothetical protein